MGYRTQCQRKSQFSERKHFANSGKRAVMVCREKKTHEFGKLESAPFFNDFDIRFANGHTDAMMLPQIKYKGKTIVYMADLLPSYAHVPLPYVMGYDTRHRYNNDRERTIFLNEALENDYILFLSMMLLMNVVRFNKPKKESDRRSF